MVSFAFPIHFYLISSPNDDLAQNVIKHLHNILRYKNTLVFTTSKSPISALILVALRHLVKSATWLDTSAFTRERNLLNVIIVINALLAEAILSNIYRYIKTKMDVVILSAYLMVVRKVIFIKVVSKSTILSVIKNYTKNCLTTRKVSNYDHDHL